MMARRKTNGTIVDFEMEHDDSRITVQGVEFCCSVVCQGTADYTEPFGGDFSSPISSCPEPPSGPEISVTDAWLKVNFFDNEDTEHVLIFKGAKYFYWFFDEESESMAEACESGLQTKIDWEAEREEGD